MKPTTRQLAMRDAALAAAMGIQGANGSNYGHEQASFGNEPGWGGDDMGFGFGNDMSGPGYYGYHGDVGFGFGADAPALAALAKSRVPMRAAAQHPAHPAHPMHPAQAARTMAIVSKHEAETARTAHREMLLHPNKGSKMDIERYDFSLNQTPNLTFGTASAIAMSLQPAVTVRPQRCAFNAPSYGFATITAILSANVNGLVGGSLDAGVYNSLSQGVHLDLPTLSPANKLTVNGNYSGLTPPGFPALFSFPFIASFQCPATVVA